MGIRKNKKLLITLSILLAIAVIVLPMRVTGEVKPITEVEDKLEGISEEEKAVLEKLFTINQELEELERQKTVITGEIDSLQLQIDDLEVSIEEKQEDYEVQLEVLEQVLVDYQRGGPATYLEILLNADKLSTFLKSINLIKDISHNVNDLLVSLEEDKKLLQEEKTQMDDKLTLLDAKEAELTDNIHKNELLQQEQEEYLASLQEDKQYYEEQLGNLKTMWTDCQTLFSGIVEELTGIINAGYFTEEDLNLSMGLFRMHGALEETDFNRVLTENSKLTETIFHFKVNQVVIEVPEKHLTLTGNFIIAGDCAIQFEVTEGTFYELPLEPSSIEELFQKGPLLIDFSKIADDMIAIDFTLDKVESREGKLAFDVIPQW